MKICVVGAGLSGSVVARSLAEAGHRVTVIEKREHIAGNCYTERDGRTGTMIHVYGPHIFHTDDQCIWNYVNRFAKMMPYVNRVKAVARNRVYSMPINLHTINQLFSTVMNPQEAKEFVSTLAHSHLLPSNFEEQGRYLLGSEIYETFFHGYTKKQWGREPKLLPSSILKRLPVRFDYNDNYFNHKYQGMPREGYTKMVEKILDFENIQVLLGVDFAEIEVDDFDHVFYSGPIDAYFNYDEGNLAYRTLEFKKEYFHGESYQGNAVVNYCDEDIPFTRITEHKYFSPWELDQNQKESVYYKEYSRECTKDDIPYYPVRLVEEKNVLVRYLAKAEAEKNVTFIGRLGTYRYLDMDVSIKEALSVSSLFLARVSSGENIPSFFIDPLK